MFKRFKKFNISTPDTEPPALKPDLSLMLLMDTPVRKKSRKKEGGPKKRNKLKILLGLILGCATLLWGFYLRAQTPAVPHLINFQSVLMNAGGIPLSDGLHDIQFRLLNANQEVLYQEKQKLESVAGVVSAMVGSAGEILPSILAPGQAKFLGVQVEGAGPETLLEIVSVPYSMIAEQALQVAPKSIGTEAIIPKSITSDLLADDVVKQLLTNLGPSSLPATIVYQDQLNSTFGSQSGASKVGVETNFIYSRGPTVQGVLKDLDTAIHQREVNLEQQKTELTQTINAQKAELTQTINAQKTELTQTINAQVSTLQAQDSNLQNQINNKVSKTGDTMAGNLDMGGNRIMNVGGPVSDSDVVTKTYVDNKISASIAEPPPGGFPPAVVASGIVKGGPFGGQPTFVSGYNIANATNSGSTGGGDTITVQFVNPVSPPYIVLVTPIDGVSNGSLYAYDMGSSQFLVNHGGNFVGFLPSFNFVVYR